MNSRSVIRGLVLALAPLGILVSRLLIPLETPAQQVSMRQTLAQVRPADGDVDASRFSPRSAGVTGVGR
jgi:hypothetical protein